MIEDKIETFQSNNLISLNKEMDEFLDEFPTLVIHSIHYQTCYDPDANQVHYSVLIHYQVL